MIEEDLSRVDESANKSTYRLGVEFERCEKNIRRVLLSLFLALATIKKRNHSNQPKSITNPIQSNPKPSFDLKRGVKRESPRLREETFVCIFYGRAGHLNDFCFRRKRIERRRVEYARNSYRDEFIDFPPRSYSHVPPYFYSRVSPRTSSRAFTPFSYVPNRRSNDFGDRFPHRPSFPAGGSYTHLSRDTCMVHVFSVVVHAPLRQVLRCKGL
jgi:hypothetical protein